MAIAVALVIVPRSWKDFRLSDDLPEWVRDVRSEQPEKYSSRWSKLIGPHKLGVELFVVEERNDPMFFASANTLHLSDVGSRMDTGQIPAVKIEGSKLSLFIADLSRWETTLLDRGLINYCNGETFTITKFRR